jgi:uncharacterized protein YodC (DUF2158 family)
MLQGAANFGIGTLALDRTCGISTLFEEETMKFAPGQIVNLKSGGQPMTVVAVDEETVECIWLGDGGEFFREPIPTLALERAYGSDDEESDTDDETDVARAASAGGDEEEDDAEDDDDDEEDEDDEEDDDEDDEDEDGRGQRGGARRARGESDESGAPRRRKRAVPA